MGGEYENTADAPLFPFFLINQCKKASLWHEFICNGDLGSYSGGGVESSWTSLWGCTSSFLIANMWLGCQLRIGKGKRKLWCFGCCLMGNWSSLLYHIHNLDLELPNLWHHVSLISFTSHFPSLLIICILQFFFQKIKIKMKEDETICWAWGFMLAGSNDCRAFSYRVGICNLHSC